MPFNIREKIWGNQVRDLNTYQPPQGPPPSSSNHNTSSEPPPSYEEWMSVRENPSSSGLPPPPTIHHEDSPANNASGDEDQEARQWCDKNPLYSTDHFKTDQYMEIINGRTTLVPLDPSMSRHGLRVEQTGFTQTVMSKANIHQCLRSQLPLYPAFHSSSIHAESFTAYFEIKVLKMERKFAIIALGFFAPPYPSFRMPGWQRASLGIHSDDGRRYVNDAFGGMGFTKPFSIGDVIGVGMEMELGRAHKDTKGPQANVKCFMTRNGERKPEWEWDLHEEVDVEVDRPGGVLGLEGDRDLYAAVGVCGNVAAEVRFGKQNCNWWPT